MVIGTGIISVTIFDKGVTDLSLIKEYIAPIQIKGETIKQIGNIVQNDTGSNLFIIRLLDGTKPFDITGYTNVTFSVLKPDNTYCVDSLGDRISVLDPEIGTISIMLHDDAINMAGTCMATLEVFEAGSHRLSSSRMSFVVTGDITEGADPTSESTYPVLLQLLSDVSGLESNVEAAEALRVTAENERVSFYDQAVIDEGNRATAEDERVIFYNQAVIDEGERASAEIEREQAEALRESGETSRDAAYTAAEAARQSNYEEEEAERNLTTDAISVWEAYNSGKLYKPLNKVTYQGSSYINIAECQGVLPTDNTKWLMIASKGADGEGAGDMLASVYDPTGKNQDAFAYADNKLAKSGGTMTGKIILREIPPYIDDYAPLNIPTGATPSEIEFDDFWRGEDTSLYHYPISGISKILDSNNTPEVTQVEAEAGTDTAKKLWTAERVKQAVLARLYNGLDKATDGEAALDAKQGKVLSDLISTKAAKSSIVNATLLAASWTGASAPYSYTLVVAGVTATSVQELLPTTTNTEAEIKALQAANITDGGQAAGSITLKAWGTKPTIDLPIRIILRGDM
jgi:hypothetical protein